MIGLKTICFNHAYMNIPDVPKKRSRKYTACINVRVTDEAKRELDQMSRDDGDVPELIRLLIDNYLSARRNKAS